jgi:hypothetical protein
MQSPKWIFEQFSNMFPQFGSSENINYYPRGNNTIKIEFKNPNFPSLMFYYTNKRDWKLVTECAYNEEAKAMEELRNQLSICQTNFTNYKRSVKK